MADDEFIKFEITDHDLENEFTPYRAKKLTKNQQIYGVWADDEGDSEDDSRSSKYSAKRSKNYTAPVSFVAGGIHQPGKKSEELIDEEEKTEDNSMISDSSDEEFARPSFFPKNKREEPNFSTSEMAGFRKKHSKEKPMTMSGGVGSWEMHTKGVGSKLLLKMGYQPGKGLGKDLQGINAPIEAHLRKGRGAIGAYGPEKKQQKMQLEVGSKDESGADGSKRSDRTSLWRKESSKSHKKIDYVYKSIDDVIEESKKPGKKNTEISECSKVMVIDMTGPEQRILSGYHAIAGVQKPVEEWEIRKDKKFTNFSMPELLHNLNLLVNVSEEDIVKNDRKLKYSDDRIKLLENQIRELDRTTKQEKFMIDGFKEMANRVDVIVKAAKEKSLTLEKAEEIFSSLKENHLTEFYAYEIPLLAISIVRPLLKDCLASWRPLQEPMKPIPEFVKWRSILNTEDSGNSMNSYKPNPYHKLVWDVWVPFVRTAVNSWECREWRPMYDLIMNWIPLISTWILENVLRDMVLTRIQKQVDEWDPQTDQIPIHLWIQPWINFLGQSFETSIYPTIRQKLSKALIKWHPSDSSARSILHPWLNVFEQGKMEAFLVNNIVPKLELVLRSFVINPREQCLDNWKWVMEWHELIPPHTMADLLHRFFFPEWLKALRMWLSNSPNFDEVSEWISGWEGMIPDILKSQALVSDNIKNAFILINEALVGETVTPVPDRPERYEVSCDDDLTNGVRRLSLKDINPSLKMYILQEPMEVKVPVSLKSKVQLLCEERGIALMPIPNRFIEANQVYRCGRLQVYFDRNFIFASQGGGSFAPMSWMDMFENAV